MDGAPCAAASAPRRCEVARGRRVRATRPRKSSPLASSPVGVLTAHFSDAAAGASSFCTTTVDRRRSAKRHRQRWAVARNGVIYKFVPLWSAPRTHWESIKPNLCEKLRFFLASQDNVRVGSSLSSLGVFESGAASASTGALPAAAKRATRSSLRTPRPPHQRPTSHPQPSHICCLPPSCQCAELADLSLQERPKRCGASIHQ